jgi:hypothetical protein
MPGTGGAGEHYNDNPRVEGGQIEIITVANPAAGVDFSYTIPAGYTFELLGVAFQLVTSATVANRACHLIVTDSGDVEVASSTQQTAVTASLTYQSSFHRGQCSGNTLLAGALSRGTINLALAEVRLLPGMKVKSKIGLIDGTDQISNIRIVGISRPYPN